MSAYPAVPLNSRGNRGMLIPNSLTPPRSPTFSRAKQSSFCSAMVESDRPSSPTIKINMKIEDVPSIATTSIISTPPPSPTANRKTFLSSTSNSNSTPAAATTSTNSSTPFLLSVSCNDRIQPEVSSPSPAKVASKSGGKRKLGPGCGLMDWIRLCRKNKNLAGTGGKAMSVTAEELARHCTEEDAWTAIRGKVYNITPYIRFHPGGKDDLMKGAGIDCTLLFDEVHKWVNVESTLKACFVGPLVSTSPYLKRKNTAEQTDTLTVSKPSSITVGVNKQALPHEVMKIKTLETRTNTQAAVAYEEPDGVKQVSPESPIKPLRPGLGEKVPKLPQVTKLDVANGPSMRLSPPPTRHRRTSDHYPRFNWVQSEKLVTVHVVTQNSALKVSDVVVDVIGQSFEAAVFIGDWVYQVNIALAHAVGTSQVAINSNRVEISLRKEVPHQQWETIGTFQEEHGRLCLKNRRGTKYHETQVEDIQSVNHDTKLFILRLPTGSYLNVPTGHHLSIKAVINGEEVVRSYTPVSALEHHPQLQEQREGRVIELMIKLYKDGKMSGFLSNLKQGDSVMVSDPEGTFDAQAKLAPACDVLLVAAGSGFTPMVKVLRDFTSTELVSQPRRNLSINEASSSEASGEAEEENQHAPELPPLNNKTSSCSQVAVSGPPRRVKLLFANKKEKDVMYWTELEHLSHATAGRFSVTHVLSEADKSWGGLRGRVNEALLRSHLPSVSPQSHQEALVCVCGPEPFTAAVTNMLMDMEFPDECIHIFD